MSVSGDGVRQTVRATGGSRRAQLGGKAGRSFPALWATLCAAWAAASVTAVAVVACLAPSTIDARACLAFVLIATLLLWVIPALLMAAGRTASLAGSALRGAIVARMALPRIAVPSEAATAGGALEREPPQFEQVGATVVGEPRW